MFTKLTSWDNLMWAFRRAAKRKRGKPNVAAFEHRLEENVLTLRSELRGKDYRPGRYVNFHIHEPKRRLISAAPFRDRVVHHALCNVIEPIFERSFIRDSYANRKRKGTHRALNRCQRFCRRHRYVLQLDIVQFFPSVDHAVLREIIGRKIDHPDVTELVDLIPFDHFVKRQLRCPGYIRYVDDMLLFADEKNRLWEIKRAVESRLERFRLTLHPAQVRPTACGIPFLGFVVYPDRRRLKRRKGVHFQRRFKRMRGDYFRGELPIEKISESVRGWVNHARYGNTVGLRKALLSKPLVRPPRAAAGEIIDHHE